MSDYTPTTDEVDTGFTTFAWDLEREHPGTYGADYGFEDYHKVCAGFRRWLAEVKLAEAARAFAQGVEAALDTTGQHGLGLLTLIGNPYAAALGLTAGQ